MKCFTIVTYGCCIAVSDWEDGNPYNGCCRGQSSGVRITPAWLEVNVFLNAGGIRYFYSVSKLLTSLVVSPPLPSRAVIVQ